MELREFTGDDCFAITSRLGIGKKNIDLTISRNGTDSLSTVVNGGGTPNNFTCVDGTQIACCCNL